MKPTKPENDEVHALERSSIGALSRLDRIPWLHAKTLKLVLLTGSNTVEHGLGRRPQGWMIHTALGGEYVVASADERALTIQVSASMTCTLEVW